ncbi:flagellar FliJ protein [Virgibacillus halotolerans]|uniref:flagellar export protein FliJ n=1 Tax=Virgibacillus halotolerans TaxID=1071053 RepID=UPI0019620530|nr:flagellar export protein FliJ [Virgibacillus halotolerans]MBM7598594.1 flagellar FliJ protein [Virgibacillus halotolerans]
MAETFVLSKILNVRENEKKNAEREYHYSMKLFEEIAEQFYHLLRKKEDAEASYENYVHTTTPIDIIREQISYIETLNKRILKLQSEVQEARIKMESKQIKLTDAHVEVKKFENMIEGRNQKKAEHLKKEENALMDEVSIQQYLLHKNG